MALARAWKQMSWLYYQYLLVTALYMLEPWERTVFSILPGSWELGPGWGVGGPGRRRAEGGEAGRREPRADSPFRGGHVSRRSGGGGRAPAVGEVLGRGRGGEDS